MKCRFYLLFFNLLFNLVAPHTLLAPSTPPVFNDITSLTLSAPLTAETQANLGLTTVNERSARAQVAADRAFSGADLVTAAELQAYAPGVYNTQQAALAAQQATIAKNSTDLTAAQGTIEGLKGDVSDAKDETALNSGLIGGLGMGGLALVGAGAAGAAYWRNNKPTLTNVNRKLKHARDLTDQMFDTGKNPEKIAEAVDAFARQQHQTAVNAIKRVRAKNIPKQGKFIRQIKQRSTASHTALTGVLEGAERNVKKQKVSKQKQARRPSSI